MTREASPEFAAIAFLKGAAEPVHFPPDQGAEVAFAGRSNAGKSSALNAITGRRALARVSRTPGRTQLVNFFALDGDRRLVDLPGYGFARVSKGVQEKWVHTLDRYLGGRRCLRGLVLLMDIRHPLTPLDRILLDRAAEAGTRVRVLLTKADKLSRGAAASALQQVRRQVPTAAVQSFSALDGTGLEEARGAVLGWLGPKKSPGPKGIEGRG